MNDPKQVIIIRKDLNMRKGKMVAQGAHASIKALLSIGFEIGRDTRPDGHWIPYKTYDIEKWMTEKFTKICVGCSSEEELLSLYDSAINAGLPCAIIKDSGTTEFNGVPTYTAIAIGPWNADDIDKITSHLKLL